MTKEFVPFELALKLQKLGFDEDCLGFYDGFMYNEIAFGWTQSPNKAPTFSQAFRWFRDELKYEVFLQKQESLISGKTYSFLIENDLEGIYVRSLSKSSIDKAELACLEKLIEIVESKKE
jgi:hypothetical protein